MRNRRVAGWRACSRPPAGVPFPLLWGLWVALVDFLPMIGGALAGSFVTALLAIPTAGALQVLAREIWQATAPDQPQESPPPAACPRYRSGTVGSAAGVLREG